jgi:hypothetical protein
MNVRQSMKDKNAIGNEWAKNTLFCDHGQVCATHELDRVNEVRHIDRFVVDLLRHQGDLVAIGLDGELYPKKGADMLYDQLKRYIKYDLNAIRAVFPQHVFSPYFNLFERHLGDRQQVKELIFRGNGHDLNRIIHSLRWEARRDGFKRVVDNHARAARKNGQSVLRYLRVLFEHYSRMRVVRLDLTYQRPYISTSLGLSTGRYMLDDTVTVGDVVRHREQFLDYLRASYPSMVGYVWKIEHGVYKSFHTHWIIFLDGHEVVKDQLIGRAMGDHWRDVITDGRGGYWNVNAVKDGYRRRGLLGIGEINWFDNAKREALERVALYLAKCDYFVRLEAPGLDRIFGKGGMPKPRQTNAGRPRGSHIKAKPPQGDHPQTTA